MPASATQVGAFPYSSWLVPDEDDTSAIWKWILAGTIEVGLIYAYLSNGSDSVRDRPNHGSNGAN